MRRLMLPALVHCVALSQAASIPQDVPLREAALVAPNYANNNNRKATDCVKKWMTPGHAQFIDHNPHVQTPEIVDKRSKTFWIKPEADQCNTPGRELQYIYDARRGGGGAVFVNCTRMDPDRMQYSPEIKKFAYYTFAEGSCASCNNCQGCTKGAATKLKDCTRKGGPGSEFVCQDANTWQVFPLHDQWFFAYYEEYTNTIGRVTLLGKDCDCGVHKGRQAFGAKLASVMIWTAALGGPAVSSLANGHLPNSKLHPVAAYIGDYAHDQDYIGGSVTAFGSRWPRAPELGAEAAIEESPPTESFGKGALHYEGGLPPCIHYFNTAAPYAKWDTKAASLGGPAQGDKDGDGDYGPEPEALATAANPALGVQPQYPQRAVPAAAAAAAATPASAVQPQYPQPIAPAAAPAAASPAPAPAATPVAASQNPDLSAQPMTSLATGPGHRPAWQPKA